MAFVAANLYKLSSNFTGMKLWGYNAGADTIATVNTAQYFNNAATDLEVGDSIRVMSSGGTVWTDVTVVSNDGTNVDVSDGVTVNITDSD